MPIIYGSQGFTAGSFSQSGYYQSTSYGGSDAPLTGYPELASGENFRTVNGAGPGGENAVDAVNTADYTAAGAVFLSLGALANGQFDTRGGIRYSWKMKPLISALNEAGTGQLFVLVNGGADGSGGLLSANVILELRHEQTSGANFDWNLRYLHPAGSNPFNGFVRTSPIVGSSGTRDDAWHDYVLDLTPSTITGSFAAGPTLGSAVVNTDGRIRVTEDGTTIFDASGLQLVINPHPLSGDALYYGRGFWHGYSDLPGPFTLPQFETGVTSSSPPIPNGGECCGNDPLPGDPDPGDTPEPPDYLPLPEFLSECDGPGLVPEGGQGVISADNWNY